MDELRYFFFFFLGGEFLSIFPLGREGKKGIGGEKREFRCIVKRWGGGGGEMQVKQNNDEDRKFSRFIIKIVRYLYKVKKHLIILLHFITLNE